MDGGDLETSNWLRWTNMPNDVNDENVQVRDCYGR